MGGGQGRAFAPSAGVSLPGLPNEPVNDPDSDNNDDDFGDFNSSTPTGDNKDDDDDDDDDDGFGDFSSSSSPASAPTPNGGLIISTDMIREAAPISTTVSAESRLSSEEQPNLDLPPYGGLM